jgi:hypothetical protein
MLDRSSAQTGIERYPCFPVYSLIRCLRNLDAQSPQVRLWHYSIFAWRYHHLCSGGRIDYYVEYRIFTREAHRLSDFSGCWNWILHDLPPGVSTGGAR